MTKSIYDNNAFFSAYKTMHDSSSTGETGFFTIPEQYALLPDLNNKSVIDMGCGFGDFLRYASDLGATKLVGIDNSILMLEAARLRSSHHDILFIQQELEKFNMQNCFDLCFSSLAIHYIQNINYLFSCVARALIKNGRFIFSVEHPIATAQPVGWEKKKSNVEWGVENYLCEGQRVTDWFGQRVIKYHRPISSWINALISAGFRIENITEPAPTDATMQIRTDAGLTSKRPAFVVFSVVKN